MGLLIGMDDITFLYESNKIEEEMSARALVDAIDAWGFALACPSPMDLSDVLGVHLRLARHLNPEIAGQVRSCAVWIGGQLKEAPIFPTVLEDSIKDWCHTSDLLLNEAGPEDMEMVIRKLHVMFEEIHPFLDFNGRTGRILMNRQRLSSGLPIDIIEDKKKMDYYAWFKQLK